jgi:hypothetical protein
MVTLLRDKKDIDAARTHLNNHVREEEILTLDKNLF